MPRRSGRTTAASSHCSSPAILTGKKLEEAEADTIEALTLLLSQKNSDSPPLSDSSSTEQHAGLNSDQSIITSPPPPVPPQPLHSNDHKTVDGLSIEYSLVLSVSDKLEEVQSTQGDQTPRKTGSNLEACKTLSPTPVQKPNQVPMHDVENMYPTPTSPNFPTLCSNPSNPSPNFVTTGAPTPVMPIQLTPMPILIPNTYARPILPNTTMSPSSSVSTMQTEESSPSKKRRESWGTLNTLTSPATTSTFVYPTSSPYGCTAIGYGYGYGFLCYPTMGTSEIIYPHAKNSSGGFMDGENERKKRSGDGVTGIKSTMTDPKETRARKWLNRQAAEKRKRECDEIEFQPLEVDGESSLYARLLAKRQHRGRKRGGKNRRSKVDDDGDGKRGQTKEAI